VTPYPALPKNPSGDVQLAGCSTSGTGANGFAQGGKCSKVKGARLILVEDAITPGYTGPVTIKLKFTNPANNWGRIGFKLKTYERAVDPSDPTGKATAEYIMNVVEGNELIPVLKCLSPCQDCKQPAKGAVNYKMYKSYCTQCWPTSPLKYLHQRPYLKPGQTDGLTSK
jgi:hypothetical protein